MSRIRVGGYVLEKIGTAQYRLVYMPLYSLQGTRWLPVKGCSRCLQDTEVVHWRGHTVDIIDELEDFERALFVYECWKIEDDRVEKLRAIRTCPKCETVLNKGDYLFFVPYCKGCVGILTDERFCIHCGLGMAPGLLKKLKSKGLDPVMVS